MGGNAEDKFVTDVERPRHRVVIPSGVSLSRFPVTQQEFFGNGKKLPVVGVNWSEAKEFANWVGMQLGAVGRLPTESEWEWAARSRQEKTEALSIDQANFLYSEDGVKVGRGALSPVGFYPLNTFGFGDIFGNVLEWVEDSWYPHYEGAPGNGNARSNGSERRVVRGGAWDYLPRLLRASWRDGLLADSKQDNLGFRIAVDFRSL